MRSPKLIAKGTATINMTPMIEVVFLLIIFFLVSSHLAKQETSIPLDLPLANSALVPTENRPAIVVNILADGSWTMGGAVLDKDALSNVLRSRTMTSPDPLQLRIRTDRTVPYARIEPVLSAAAANGIGDVVFSVYEDRTR